LVRKPNLFGVLREHPLNLHIMALVINLNPNDEQKKAATAFDDLIKPSKIWSENQIYGGENATVKGEWRFEIITLENDKGAKQIPVAGFAINDKIVDYLSVNGLAFKSDTDTTGNVHTTGGSVRNWAKSMLLPGKSKTEGLKALCDLLNKKGLKVSVEYYEMFFIKDGESRRWTKTVYHLYFGDDKI
jgi:hypothetical protein